jgi:hypothetical protein
MREWLAMAMAAAMGVAAGQSRAAEPDSTNGWGYGYDSLLQDLARWKRSPYVRVDSIGASVQGRALWMVSITGQGDSVGRGGDLAPRKRRVFVHARTHPAEVQANHIADEMIKLLTGDSPQADSLRRDYIFDIIPMYNPDGVELGKARQNAHGVDIESNWDENPMEPEPTALKKAFMAFMSGPIPIEVALNLHSDQFNCTRFFFFHYAAGTSNAYAALEKDFIGGVQARFPDGIKNWDFVQSWANGTVTHYPEGFWWVNHGAKVMALTYEDTNCPNAGRFDSTGRALALGSSDYLKAHAIVAALARAPGVTRMLLEPGGIRIPAGNASRWEVLDPRGRVLAAGAAGPEGDLLAWEALPSAPVRIFAWRPRGGAAERLMLPAFPR